MLQHITTWLDGVNLCEACMQNPGLINYRWWWCPKKRTSTWLSSFCMTLAGQNPKPFILAQTNSWLGIWKKKKSVFFIIGFEVLHSVIPQILSLVLHRASILRTRLLFMSSALFHSYLPVLAILLGPKTLRKLHTFQNLSTYCIQNS